MSAVRRPRRRFDAERFARQANYSIDFSDRTIDICEDRISALEEIVAARWPRSWLLRRRLARSLRASVAGYATVATRRAPVAGDRRRADLSGAAPPPGRVMKAAAIVFADRLVLAHPAVAVAVLAVELAACAVLAGLICRALRPLSVPAGRHRRT